MPYVPVPDFTENEFLKKSKVFKRAVARALELKEIIEDAEREYDNLRNETLLPVLIEAGAERVGIDGAQVGIVVRQPGKRLDRTKLIAAMTKRGYDLSVIEEGSTVTEGSTYVDVRRGRDTDGGEAFPTTVRKAVKTSAKSRTARA